MNRQPTIQPPRADDSVLETARRLLCVHYRIIAGNLPGAAAARSPTPLHDIRVAIRRLCAVLRAFRKPLARTSASRLAKPFAQLNSDLGPIRDSDVWLAYLRGKKVRRRLQTDPAWPAYQIGRAHV
jgi:CHAD domain-containing protein